MRSKPHSKSRLTRPLSGLNGSENEVWQLGREAGEQLQIRGVHISFIKEVRKTLEGLQIHQATVHRSPRPEQRDSGEARGEFLTFQVLAGRLEGIVLTVSVFTVELRLEQASFQR